MRFVALLGLIALPGFAQHVGVLNPSRGMQAPVGAYQYGNILFPGGIGNSHASRLGASIGEGSYTGVGPGVVPGRPGGRPRTVVVPYAYPVYYGGGGYYQEPQPTNVTVVVPQQQVPQVIINNTYAPPEPAKSSLKEYSAGELSDSNVRVYGGAKPRTESAAAATAPARSIMDEKPTIFLIALMDGTIRQAIGYWVQDDTLHYVTPKSSVNHLSIQMVDRERSVELNAERKLEFDLRLSR